MTLVQWYNLQLLLLYFQGETSTFTILIHTPNSTNDRSVTHSLQISRKYSISQIWSVLYFRDIVHRLYHLDYIFFFGQFHFPASGQFAVTGVVPSPPRFLPSIFIAHMVQQSHCSSTFHRVLLTHALALSASQFVHKKKSQRIYTSMHSAGPELTKLTYTRLEDNLIRHRGDRLYTLWCAASLQLLLSTCSLRLALHGRITLAQITLSVYSGLAVCDYYRER